MKKTLFLILIFIGLSTYSFGETYKCVNEKGSITFTSGLCPSGTYVQKTYNEKTYKDVSKRKEYSSYSECVKGVQSDYLREMGEMSGFVALQMLKISHNVAVSTCAPLFNLKVKTIQNPNNHQQQVEDQIQRDSLNRKLDNIERNLDKMNKDY